VGDTLVRAAINNSGQGVGLRGGQFEVVDGAAGLRVVMHAVRWTEDVAVTGEAHRFAPRNGVVQARVSLVLPHGGVGKLAISWNDAEAHPKAIIRGRLDGRVVSAVATAP
jgi:hypothetical protein